MTTVTVDLKDLETIVFATGVIKTIEGSLAAFRRDPFVQPHLNFTDAHNRLAALMRDATRAEAGTLVPYNEPLDKEELSCLRAATSPGFYISRSDKAPKEGEAMSIWDRLMSKGMIAIGQIVTGSVYTGASAVESLVVDPTRFAIKITDRGRNELMKAAA